jgi:carboxypeptidase C (cathepsin A)
LNSKTHPDLQVLVYSGDDDGVCGTVGTQRWIYDLGFPVKKLWNTWEVDGQTAGYTTDFETPGGKDSRFTFTTVHFAGHEVPTYKPKEALELFKTFGQVNTTQVIQVNTKYTNTTQVNTTYTKATQNI